MSLAVPIVNRAAYGMQAPPTAVAGAGHSEATASGTSQGGGGGMLVGPGMLPGAYNTPVHVAALVVSAFAVIVLLNLAGFRFAGTAGVKVGG